MPRSLRYCLIAFALAALAFVAWNGLSRDPQAADDGATSPAAGPAGAIGTASPSGSEELFSERIESARDSEVQDPEGIRGAPVVGTRSTNAPADAATFTARFVDKFGNALPGVLLREVGRGSVSTTSDDDGRVALEIGPPERRPSWSTDFIARRTGFATTQLTFRLTVNSTTPLGDVVLGPGVDVHGRTVDENGVGIATTVGRDVANYDPAQPERLPNFEQLNLQSRLVVKSDANGDFSIDGLPLGELRLWAKNEETRMAWSEPIRIVEGTDVRDLILTVPRPRWDELITGVVLLPDGQPAAQAFVSCAYFDEPRSGSTGVWAGDDGRFRVLIEPGCTRYDLTATDRDERYSSVTLRDVKPGDRDLGLRISETHPRFFIELRGPSGKPVDLCFMRLHSETGPRQWRSEQVDPESLGGGRHELPVPTTRFRLEVKVEGCRTYRTEELDPPLPGSTLEIRLERATFLRGRVFFEGKPAARADLSSFKDRSADSLEVGGFRSRHTSRRESEVVAKLDGTFELPCGDEGLYWIRAEAPGCAAVELGPLDPANSASLVLELVRGGVLEGVVILPGGADAEGTVVAISCGDGLPMTRRASAGGRFRFEQLTPGPWQVQRREAERDLEPSVWGARRGEAEAIEWSCEVRDGRTTRFDLDLSRP
ncbi:MAG: carboxypeptidase regulatory-like domain-containing protein [Planctomycetaceae bacterium]|nr:carboxypeptidase regulatory-like domain-containing protein [Planctomycetaceae bacterium]